MSADIKPGRYECVRHRFGLVVTGDWSNLSKISECTVLEVENQVDGTQYTCEALDQKLCNENCPVKELKGKLNQLSHEILLLRLKNSETLRSR